MKKKILVYVKKGIIIAFIAMVQSAPLLAKEYRFEPGQADSLKPVGVKVEAATHQGREAIRVTYAADEIQQSGGTFAILPFPAAGDFTLDLELAGAPMAGAGAVARGFVGVAFHVSEENSAFEEIYLRPANGRAKDQLRRNHSTQYASHPEYPWYRLRQETPGVYESYVDLVPDVWTKVRIVVEDIQAKLYVHGSDQPTLIVNDLKRGAIRGHFALWVGPGTVAHFTNIALHTH